VAIFSPTHRRVPRYACIPAHHLHGTDHACQSVGGVRLERSITGGFLDAITPAGIPASARAIVWDSVVKHLMRLAGRLDRGVFCV
jgi:hypothetical protein